jgi:membrane-bound ClpP family serine protease
VAWPVIALMAMLTGGFMLLIMLIAIRRQRHKTAPGLVGSGISPDTMGEVRQPLSPIGSVYAGGEEWTARTADERLLKRGTRVRVVSQEGLTLIVETTDGTAGA